MSTNQYFAIWPQSIYRLSTFIPHHLELPSYSWLSNESMLPLVGDRGGARGKLQQLCT